MFDDADYQNSIVLVHGHDLIFVDDADAEDIINEVLSAIDYYSKWEAKLWETAAFEDGLQRMLDLSANILANPSRIVDVQGRILAIDRSFGPDEYSRRWKNMCDTGVVQLSNVSL